MSTRFEHRSLHARLASAACAAVLTLATGAAGMLQSSQAHATSVASPQIVRPWVEAAGVAFDRRLPDQYGCGSKCNVVGQPAPAISSEPAMLRTLPPPILVAPHGCTGGCMKVGQRKRFDLAPLPAPAALPEPILVAPHACVGGCMKVGQPASASLRPEPAVLRTLPPPVLMAPRGCGSRCGIDDEIDAPSGFA